MGNYGLGTPFGDRVNRDYLVNASYAKGATSARQRKAFQAVVDLFRKYSDRYQMDFLLMAAQGYQESELNQHARSPVGAIGIMQIMPATGKPPNVGDITQLEPNIHAGVKFMRDRPEQELRERADGRSEQSALHLRAYNAGPNRIPPVAAGSRAARPEP